VSAQPGPHATLRSQLLRWLLIPLSVLFIVDAVGSYFLAQRLSDGVYDGELMEIARELSLHVRPNGAMPAFDLEKDAERTLLLDQYDRVYYVVRGANGAWVAGDDALPARPGGGDARFYDSSLAGEPIRVAELRTQTNGNAPVTVQVAETSRSPRTNWALTAEPGTILATAEGEMAPKEPSASGLDEPLPPPAAMMSRPVPASSFCQRRMASGRKPLITSGVSMA